jgi:hypothetical protein
MVITTQSPPGYSTSSSFTTYVTYHMHSVVKISIYIIKKLEKSTGYGIINKIIKISQIYTRKKIPISLSKIGKILLGNKTLAIKEKHRLCML